VGRRVVLFASVVAALACSGSALAATPLQLTIAASDGAKLACSLVEPDGAAPTGGWPAVMLFHGLGGKHQDMEPTATQYLTPAGYAALECDARGHGVSEGLFGLDGARALVAQRSRAYFRNLSEFLAQLPEGAAVDGNDITVASQYFLASARVTIGDSQARGSALLSRDQTGWPSVVWRRYP